MYYNGKKKVIQFGDPPRDRLGRVVNVKNPRMWKTQKDENGKWFATCWFCQQKLAHYPTQWDFCGCPGSREVRIKSLIAVGADPENDWLLYPEKNPAPKKKLVKKKEEK